MNSEPAANAWTQRSTVSERIALCAALYIDAKRVLANGLLLADRADNLNACTHRRFFCGLQRDYATLTYVRVAALFEDSKQNQTHSLPHLLRFLASERKSADHRAIPLLQAYGGYNEFETFASLHTQKPLSDYLKQLKTERDRAVAHVDRKYVERAQSDDAQEGVSYRDCANLIEHARCVLVTTRVIYLNQNLGKDDEPVISFEQSPTSLSRVVNALAG